MSNNMNKFVVVSTVRTGSTLLTHLLTEQYNCHNFGEDWKVKSADLPKDTYNKSIKLFYSKVAPGSLEKLFEAGEEQKKRLEIILNETEGSWVLKLVAGFASGNHNFISRCIADPNVKVIFTHRRDIVKQFTSMINAYYRRDVLKYDGGGWEFKNNTVHQPYSRIDFSENQLVNQAMIFCKRLIEWRAVFEIYKNNITVISYEDNIVPLKLDSLGITNETIEKYNTRDDHIVPTPHNVTNFLHSDTWDQCVKFIESHKHFVDI